MANRETPVTAYAIAVFLGLSLIELVLILWLNQGMFVFSLDDPYIHLAVAENLLKGHYGVNLHEYSAPSSSILWPFLIAPFSTLAFAGIAVLFLNIIFAALSLPVLAKILDQAVLFRQQALSGKAKLLLLLAFIVVANLAGLAFTGMEHNLQVLLALVILLGLLQVVNGNTPAGWLWLAIIAMPLVRYEGAALSAAALLFLFMQRYYWQSVLGGAVITVLLLLFSLFLLSLGLGYLPDSVLAKSDVAASGLEKLLANLQRSVLALSPPAPKGLFLLAGCVFLVWRALQQSHQGLRCLLLVIALAVFMHLLGGRIGWFWRYELYIWSVLSALVVFLCLVEREKRNRWFAAALFIVSLEHLFALALTPAASSNIYLQQYQMHRFVVDYYQKPVAINDLGWPSFHNPHYVLDLWGLGSSEARQLRHNAGDDVAWMDNLAQRHGVELIMIYHHPVWFPTVPDNWIKLGELDSDRFRVTARMPVSFYSRCEPCLGDMQQKLNTFADTLPSGAMFIRAVPASEKP